jgi:hypothetical protein
MICRRTSPVFASTPCCRLTTSPSTARGIRLAYAAARAGTMPMIAPRDECQRKVVSCGSRVDLSPQPKCSIGVCGKWSWWRLQRLRRDLSLDTPGRGGPSVVVRGMPRCVTHRRGVVVSMRDLARSGRRHRPWTRLSLATSASVLPPHIEC